MSFNETETDFHGLPGAELISKGLRDLHSGTRTEEALLVLIGAPRLQRTGVQIPAAAFPVGEFPTHELYTLLEEKHDRGAHSRYNALLRRLISFERALEHERSATRRHQ